jgi:molybdate transport system regulatory protein
LSIRLDIAPGVRIGPGKVALLEQIADTGSISGAGRAMTMSYRRAWDLVEELNRALNAPVAETAAGGSGGGGTRLTALGCEIVAQYRALEAEMTAMAHDRLQYLASLCPEPNAIHNDT